jgi:hypothetical protein
MHSLNNRSRARFFPPASLEMAESCKIVVFNLGAQIRSSRRHCRNIVAGQTMIEGEYMRE